MFDGFFFRMWSEKRPPVAEHGRTPGVETGGEEAGVGEREERGAASRLLLRGRLARLRQAEEDVRMAGGRPRTPIRTHNAPAPPRRATP